MDPSSYSVVLPAIDRGQGDPQDFSLRGTVHFERPQSLLSLPHTIKVVGRFLDSDDQPIHEATIVGYHQLRVKVLGSERAQPLCGYKLFDERIADLVRKIDSEVGEVDPAHREDFLAALSAVANYAGYCAQEARYREGMHIMERTFRQDLVQHLRRCYGEDVTVGEEAAGGPTDIKYRSIPIEVKVERELTTRNRMVQKYVQQPAQYTAGAGAQLGILCILDVSEKKLPSAAPQNQIQLHVPLVHGFQGTEAPFATYIAVVFIDGNLRRPSSFSR
jgi:hypothetical protein